MSAALQETISAKKRARLLEFLGSLPPAAAAKVFAALEQDRARGGTSLPHDLILDRLRTELAAQGGRFPIRPKTAQRIFFAPFEDLFVSFRSGKKRKARIARASLSPIWTLIREDPACAAAGRAAAALEAAIREGSGNLAAYEDSLLSAASLGVSRLIAHADADQRFKDSLAERLGGEAAFEDFAEIKLLFSLAPHLKTMQERFPRPVAAPTEEDIYKVRRLYEAAREDSPAAAPYLLLALMGRMERPWRALRLHYGLADLTGEAFGDDATAIVDVILDDLEGAARMLERDAAGELDARDAELRVTHFADFAEGVADEAERAGDKVMVNRIEACRDLAAESLARFTEQSLAALRRAMPVRHAGGSSKLMALRPDFARPMAPRILSAAREAARFLAGSDEMARRLDRRAIAAGIVADAIEEARRYGNDLVLEIRAAEGEDRVAARRLMEQVIDIARPLLQPDEIGLLRERAAAAALTA
jgi:hypothetical protein